MAITTTWANKPTTPTDVAVNFIDQSDLALRDEAFDPKTGTYTAEYVLNDGAVTDQTIVGVLVRQNKDGSQFASIRLATNRRVDDGTDVIEDGIGSMSISFTVPSVQADAASVAAMLGALYSLTFNGVTSKVPNTGHLGLLSRGLVGQLYG